MQVRRLFGDHRQCGATSFTLEVQHGQAIQLAQTRGRVQLTAEAKNRWTFGRERAQRYAATMLIRKAEVGGALACAQRVDAMTVSTGRRLVDRRPRIGPFVVRPYEARHRELSCVAKFVVWTLLPSGGRMVGVIMFIPKENGSHGPASCHGGFRPRRRHWVVLQRRSSDASGTAGGV